ncbi:PEP-CTERM sorting domain-containing protein [bacterium]|nr:PEP-CTERM sorting domain-containing protein [bacterium]
MTGIDFFESLPQGAVPLTTSPLVDAVSDAGSGGANELLNPIDGQPLLFDVYGSPRTNGLGFRNTGAVQAAPVPEPSSWVLAGMAAGMAGWWRLRRRAAKLATHG